VLSVNYRSGIGYGMEFREALNYGASAGPSYTNVQGAGRLPAFAARRGLCAHRRVGRLLRRLPSRHARWRAHSDLYKVAWIFTASTIGRAKLNVPAARVRLQARLRIVTDGVPLHVALTGVADRRR